MDKGLQFFSSDNKTMILNFLHCDYSGDKTMHSHMQSEYLFITDGKGKVELENGYFIDVVSDDILFFDGMQAHKVIPLDSSFNTITINFDICSFINEDYRAFSKNTLDIFFSQIKTAHNKISGVTAEKLADIIFELEDELNNVTESANAVIKSLVILMLSYTVRYYNEKFEYLSVKKIRHYSEVQKTIIYINENLNDNLTLENLAKIANMNKSYYSTVFKKVTGMTVWEYILNARIELAISYLLKNDADYSITEIFGLCGFNNASAFNKTFKKVTGKTPTEFKNSKYNLCFSK